MADNALDYSPPSRNPGDADTLTGLFKLAFTKWLQKTDDMLPAKVVSYDAATNVAKVQPQIEVVSTGAQQIARPAVASVPVYQASGGGFILRFPIANGDLGWIKANDRDISIFKQTNSSSAPNTQRKHSFEDAIFIPQCAFSAVSIADEDVNNMVLQNYAGTVKIAMWNNLIKIISAGGIGIGGTPGPGALLDLQSTDKAFGLPEMSTSQRNAIPSPRKGFMIYNTDTNSVDVYTNTGWP